MGFLVQRHTFYTLGKSMYTQLMNDLFFSWLRTSASRSETLYLTENSWKVASGDFRLYGLGVCGDGDWELDAKSWFQIIIGKCFAFFLSLPWSFGKNLQVEHFSNWESDWYTWEKSAESQEPQHWAMKKWTFPWTHSVFVWVCATWYGCRRVYHTTAQYTMPHAFCFWGPAEWTLKIVSWWVLKIAIQNMASISLKSVMFAYFSKVLSPKFNPGPNFNCFSLSPTGCNWFLFLPWATKSVFCVVSSPNS